MKAPISVCLITRQDPNLEKCILSFINYVEEICVLITADDDFESMRIATKLGCKVLKYTGCNENNKIIDFSDARNKNFEMATQPWIMWIDSDDILVGAKHLNDLIKITGDVAYVFPYEYSYNAEGVVNCRHYRERLISNKNAFHWIGPVHEVMVAKDGYTPTMIKSDVLIYKHQRQYLSQTTEPGRNLRILKEYVKKVPDDARQMYYIGLEYCNNNDIENAVKYLSMYIDKSGWDDERAMAAYRLVDIYSNLQNYKEGLRWSLKSIEIKPNWFESYFAATKMFYYLKHWKQCVDFGKLALSYGKTETLLFINDSDRTEIHNYLNVALSEIGDIRGALDSAIIGLEKNPNNNNLIFNKKIFEKLLNIKNEEAILLYDKNKLNIIFMIGPANEYWTPDTVEQTGIGGSELMAIHNARELAALGHNVRVYAMCDGVFDNVKYINYNKYNDLACDVLVVSRNAIWLGDNFNITARLKLLWCHDVCAYNATNALLLKADRILALSQWHKDNLIQYHNVPDSQVIVTRNGIDLNRFNKDIKRDELRCMNSSSPDRSWAVLLDCWKDIVAAEPNATLHLYYGFLNWKASAHNDLLQMDLINRLEQQIASMPSVIFHDRVNQKELAEAFLSSKALLYPTWFTETSCISHMEAQAAGCWIVTSPIAALKETDANYNKTIFINGVWTSEEYKKDFVAATIRILNEK